MADEMPGEVHTKILLDHGYSASEPLETSPLIYLALDSQGDQVMIRVTTELSSDLLREIQILQRLDAIEDIIHVLDVFENDGNTYVVTEYVSGPTLAKFVRDEMGRPGPELFFSIAYNLANTIMAIHALGIVHLNLRADTILVHISKNQHPRCILTGFNLACSAERTTTDLQCRIKSIKGLPQYFSPELFLANEEPLNVGDFYGVDVWAVGILLYFIASGGRMPYVGTSPGELRRKILSKEGGPLPLDSSHSTIESFFEKVNIFVRNKYRSPMNRVQDLIRGYYVDVTASLLEAQKRFEELEEDVFRTILARRGLSQQVESAEQWSDIIDRLEGASGALSRLIHRLKQLS